MAASRSVKILGKPGRLRVRGLVNTMFYDIDVAPTQRQDFRRRRAGQRKPGDRRDRQRRESFCTCWAATARGWCSTPRTRTTSTARAPTYTSSATPRPSHWSEDFWEEISPKAMKAERASSERDCGAGDRPGASANALGGLAPLWRSTAGRARLAAGFARTRRHGDHGDRNSCSRAGTGVGRHEPRRHLPQPRRRRDLVGRSFGARDSGARDHAHRNPSAKSLASGGDGRRNGHRSRGRFRASGRAARRASPAGRKTSRTCFCRKTGGVTWRPIDNAGDARCGVPRGGVRNARTLSPVRRQRLRRVDDGRFRRRGPTSRRRCRMRSISDLVYHHRDRSLTAATYGRGIWRRVSLASRRPFGYKMNYPFTGS